MLMVLDLLELLNIFVLQRTIEQLLMLNMIHAFLSQLQGSSLLISCIRRIYLLSGMSELPPCIRSCVLTIKRINCHSFHVCTTMLSVPDLVSHGTQTQTSPGNKGMV
jgi:hypothetical protein